MNGCSCRSRVPTGLRERVCCGFLVVARQLDQDYVQWHYERTDIDIGSLSCLISLLPTFSRCQEEKISVRNQLLCLFFLHGNE